MAGQKYPQRVNTDSFGRKYTLTKMVNAVNKKSGEVYHDIWKGYIEVGGKSVKIEVSNSNKETKNGHPTKWLKATVIPAGGTRNGGYGRGGQTGSL